MQAPHFNGFEWPDIGFKNAAASLTLLTLDSCLYLKFNKAGKLCSVVGVHVDDLIIRGDPSDESYKMAKEELQPKFNFKHSF